MHAIIVTKPGGVEVLSYQEVEIPQPKTSEVLVKISAIGVNFIDVYHRTGLYPLNFPFIPGKEAAGVVEEVGTEVTEFKKGDRVAYVSTKLGNYAEYAVVPPTELVRIPDALDEQSAAAVLLQGMTAHYLTHSTYPIQKGDTILVHAAAGGVGSLLIQMARRLGARVIGTVSTEEKAKQAYASGAHEVILYTQKDFEKEVERITQGKGVAVVYDSVGKTTFEKSLLCLRPRGYLISFGQSSGGIPPFDLSRLAKKSLFITRPKLSDYVSDRKSLLKRAGDVFHRVTDGTLKINIWKTYSLQNAAQAQRDLESREAMGKLLLLP